MRASLLALLLPAAGCYLSHQLGPDGGDAGIDAGLDAGQDAGRDAALPPLDGGCDAGEAPDGGAPELVVDLLFVVDNSRSMAEEQQALATQFPAMLRILVTGDVDGDGASEFHPVRDLRVGVITTEVDVGVADGICDVRAEVGDDGVLRTEITPPVRRCDERYPRFLQFIPGGSVGEEQIVADFACVAQVGTEGCGMEQPLEAALKALSPAGDMTFLAGTGHGDGENAGFVRDGSVLGVIVVTDENDCSIADRELAEPVSDIYPHTGDRRDNLRCFQYAEALAPIERYVDGFRRLRSHAPESFLFAAITGVPADLVSDPTAIDYDALLADSRMREAPDPGNVGHLRPACDVVGIGFASPGRRLVEVARGLGDNATVQSICDESFGRALTGITSQLGRIILRHTCR